MVEGVRLTDRVREDPEGVEQVLSQEVAQARTRRLQDWRTKILEEPSYMRRWIRGAGAVATRVIYDKTKQEEPSDDRDKAAKMLADF